MNKLKQVLGRILFIATWPLLYVYLRFSKRTRVIIVCNNEILVVKGWFSVGNWGLPGGGLHGGEQPINGAIREVWEETGISLKPNQLAPGDNGLIKGSSGFKYYCYTFVAEFTQKPVAKTPSGELVDIRWMPIDLAKRSPTVRKVLELTKYAS